MYMYVCCTYMYMYVAAPTCTCMYAAPTCMYAACTCMSPTLNGRSTLQHFECSNVVKKRNKIMFSFYPGLPHMLIKCW